MKRILAVIASFLLCSILFSAVSFASPVEEAEKFGEGQRAVLDQNLDEVLYKIDDTLKITREELILQCQALAYINAQNAAILDEDIEISDDPNAGPSGTSAESYEEEVLNALVDRLVQLAKANELGVSSSYAAAAAYLDGNMEQMDRARFTGTDEEKASAQQMMDIYRATISGYGMTEIEYREKIQIPALVNSLTISLLRQNYFEEHGISEGSEDSEALYNQYIQQLREEFPNRP